MTGTTLYLVRHGETVDNANQIMQGQTQGELNENGIRQAQEVSEAWKDRPIDVVIASDRSETLYRYRPYHCRASWSGGCHNTLVA